MYLQKQMQKKRVLDEISCALIFGGGGSGGTNINDEAKGWGGVTFSRFGGGSV